MTNKLWLILFMFLSTGCIISFFIERMVVGGTNDGLLALAICFGVFAAIYGIVYLTESPTENSSQPKEKTMRTETKPVNEKIINIFKDHRTMNRLINQQMLDNEALRERAWELLTVEYPEIGEDNNQASCDMEAKTIVITYHGETEPVGETKQS